MAFMCFCIDDDFSVSSCVIFLSMSAYLRTSFSGSNLLAFFMPQDATAFLVTKRIQDKVYILFQGTFRSSMECSRKYN